MEVYDERRALSTLQLWDILHARCYKLDLMRHPLYNMYTTKYERKFT